MHRQRHLSLFQVVAPGEIGGLERVVQALSLGLHRRGHSCRVVTIGDDEVGRAALCESLRDHGVEITELDLARRRYLKESRQLRNLILQHRPDVVHTHGYHPDIVVGNAARRIGWPTVTTVHGFTGGDWKNRVYESLQIRAIRRFDAVVAVSRPLEQLLGERGVPANSLRMIRNAWSGTVDFLERDPARVALGLPNSSIVLGWVGRLSTEKGADVLIEALPLLRDLPIHVSVVGVGPEAETLREVANRLGVGDRITWHGSVRDAARYFAAFDCFVLSSRTEGTPIVLFEAMAAGVPIAATAVGGVPDMLSASEAILVQGEDREALAAAIRETVTDRRGAIRRTTAARWRLAREFGMDEWVLDYESLYRLLSSRREASTSVR